MAVMSVRDNEGHVHKSIIQLKESRNENNPFKDRSISWIVLEILQSSESIDEFVKKHVLNTEASD